MNKKDETKKKAETLPTEKRFFDKQIFVSCGLSAGIAFVAVFIMLKVGLNSHDKQIDELCEQYSTIDNRIKSISDTLTELSADIEKLHSEWKEGKESSSYIYTSISALQKDVAMMKSQLHIDTHDVDDFIKKLPSTKSSFIEAFENLINEGVPFDSFLESYSDKIDMKKYRTSNDIIKFSKNTVKSVSDLKKDVVAIGYKLFQTKISESFWEKQKRVLKEKFSETIKIRKTDETTNLPVKTQTDKQKFEMADRLLSDGNFEKALALIEEIKVEDEELSELISDLHKRIELETAFSNFKKEFLELESSEDQPSVEKKAS